MSEFENCIFKDCKWFSNDFEQNCSGYGEGEPAIASCKRFAEIQPILDRLETTTKMHERACNDIQEYSETIEAQSKEIAELKFALEDSDRAVKYLANDYCELCDWSNCGIDQLFGMDRCIERIKELAKESE